MKIKLSSLTERVSRYGSMAALAAALVAGASTALAQQGHHDHDDHDDGYYDGRVNIGEIRRVAMENGYREGAEHGAHDRRERATFNSRHGDVYQEADRGYRDEFGSRGEYQNAFRQAYQQGYSDAYYGRGRGGRYGDQGYYDQEHSRYDPYASSPTYRRNRNNSYGGYGSGGVYTNDPRYRTDREGDLDREEVARRAAQQGYYDGYQRGQYDRSRGTRRGNPQGHGAYEHALNGFDPEWGSAMTFQQYYRQYFVRGYEAGFGQRTMDRRYSRRWW